MGEFKVCFVLLLSVYMLAILLVTANSVEKRAITHYEIELLIVVDYSAYINWYKRTPNNETASQRQHQTFQNMKEYLGTILHSTNLVYKRLESDNIYLQIRLVDVVFETHASESPWTETVKHSASPKPTVHSVQVLELFKVESKRLQATIPHDYAILFTWYDLVDNGQVRKGYAYEGHCKDYSVSLLSDMDDFFEASLMAHELGHSVGCNHDGDGNPCPTDGGYVMEADTVDQNDKKWYFSNCSVNYIRTYLNHKSSSDPDCLTTHQNLNRGQGMAQITSKLFGQVYTADQQCKLLYGQDSHFAREISDYDNTFEGMCMKFYCYVTGREWDYYWNDGGDGIPCGNGKWCLANQCVWSTSAPQVADNCPAGDQEGVVENGVTCQALVKHDLGACNRHDIKRKCCHTCANTITHVADGDAQCRRHLGNSSFICRAATAYDGKLISEAICDNLMCHDPSKENWCRSYTADDRTPCGQQKWCVNEACVHDAEAPVVPDSCPWGDRVGVVTHGLTCSDISQSQHSWRCYDSFVEKTCCDTCQNLMTNNSACRFGDQSDWCYNNIGSRDERRMCYFGTNDDLCCGSCSQYVDHSNPGCLYGDKYTNCRRSRCDTYDDTRLQNCCGTCHRISAPVIG